MSLMGRSFDHSLTAMVQAILAGHGIADNEESARVASFVRRQWGRMPDYLRLPLALVTLVFDWYPCLFRGRPFHRLAQPSQVAQLTAWKNARLGVRRDLIKFYEGLSIFAWQADHYGDS